MPKRAKKSEVKPQERKPVSIEEARDALLESIVCWAWFLNSQGDENENDYLEAIKRDRCDLFSIFDASVGDSVLGMPSGVGNLTAIALALEIAAAITFAESTRGRRPTRQAVLEIAERRGIPVKVLEVLAVSDKIKLAIESPPKRVDESRLVFDASDFDMDRSTVSRRARDHKRFGDGILHVSRGQYAVRKELVADFIKPTRQDKGRPFYP